MDNLEKSLAELSKINPSKRFESAAKKRILHQIRGGKQDAWLWNFVKTLRITPSRNYIFEARKRLMHQIQSTPGSLRVPLTAFGSFLKFTKRAVASTLVMILAAVPTLFYVEGQRNVSNAANSSFLEVLSGTASVKHADGLTWEQVDRRIQLQAGDLIQMEEGEQAVIQFFDDTQVRLDENSTLLIGQLTFSPNFSSQGIIETYLQEGRAWVQALNVEDGYAHFSLETGDLLTEALHASFSVTAASENPEELLVFTGRVDVSELESESKNVIQTQRFTANKYITLSQDEDERSVLTLPLTPEQKKTQWAVQNLEKDKQYLAEVRERSYERLTIMAGTLPGETLYPIKQAKERLKLTFGEDDEALSIKIELANNRLNEAIVLFERGDIKAADEALLAYQSLVDEIRKNAGSESEEDRIVAQLVIPHQKVLSVQPANKNAIAVKEKLQETAESFVQDPLELERKKLSHSVEDLQDVLDLIEEGETELARGKLVGHEAVQDELLGLIESLDDEDEKRILLQEVLEFREEEKELLALTSETLLAQDERDQELIVLIAEASKEAAVEVKEIQEVALPLLPELAEKMEAEEGEEQLNDEFLEISELVARIYIYESWDGQLNQILNFFGDDFQDPTRIDYLKKVLNQLHGRARDYMGIRILQLQNQIDAAAKLAETEAAEDVDPSTIIPDWLDVEYNPEADENVVEEVSPEENQAETPIEPEVSADPSPSPTDTSLPLPSPDSTGDTSVQEPSRLLM